MASLLRDKGLRGSAKQVVNGEHPCCGGVPSDLPEAQISPVAGEAGVIRRDESLRARL